jgi:hypothetical protein
LRPAVALDEQELTARPVVSPLDDEPELASEPVEQRANGVWQPVCGYRGNGPPRRSRLFLRPFAGRYDRR